MSIARPWPRPVAEWRVRRRPVSASLVVLVAIAIVTTLLVTILLATGLHTWRFYPVAVAAAMMAILLATRKFDPRRLAARHERGAEVLGDARVATVAGEIDGERRGALARDGGHWTLPLLLLALVGPPLAALLVVRHEPGLAAVAGVTLVGPAGLWLLRYVWQGGIDVHWDPESLAPGRVARFLVSTPGRGSRLLDARYLLRCCGALRTDAAHRGRDAWGVIWSAELAAERGAEPGPDEPVAVTFELPESVPEADLEGRPPTFWELIVRGRTMWGTVTESFLVPIRRHP